MDAVVAKWGNSAAVRIPASVMQDAGLKPDQKVSIVAEAGRVIITPSEKIEYALGELIAAMAPGNAHPGVDTGLPVGHEAL